MAFATLILMLISGLIPKYGQRIAYAIGLVGITVVFCIMNMNKVPFSDWVWYTEHYQMTQNYSFSEYLGARLGWITIKWNEPVYYFLARQVANLSGGSTPALAATITVTNYAAIGTAVYLLGSSIYREAGKSVDGILLLGVAILAITFTLVTQLVRQELATSFAILGFAFFLRNRLFVAGLCAILAAGAHQSAALVLLILYVPAATFKWVSKPSTRNLALVVGAIAIYGIGYYISNSSIADLGRKDDGSIDTTLVYFDIAILVTLSIIKFVNRQNTIYLAIILTSFIYFWVMMASMVQVPLAMLRLYFTVDFIRAISILIIVITLIPKRFSLLSRYSVGWIFLLFSLVYVNSRVERSPFDYGDKFTTYLAYPIVFR